MPDASQHLSDQVILLFVDKELPAKKVKQVQEHLLNCPACRDRQSAVENTSDALLGLYRSEPKADSSSIESRVRLQIRLAELQKASFRRRGAAGPLLSRFAISAALAAVFALLVFEGMQAWQSRSGVTDAKTEFLVPNHSLTPGAVHSVTLAEVCSASDKDLDPEVSPAVEKAVLDEYGLRSAERRRDYQIDYLVNPQLGGTSAIRNLWPQPYSAGKWNAHAKDELERRLRQMVCAGTVGLAAAQRDIATDWIAAYKRYMGNERS